MVGPQGTRPQMIAAAMTNTRGEYRFRQAPGRYQVVVEFVSKTRETGETVLPETFPQASDSDTSSYFDVGSGEEKHIDLRPRTGIGYPVEVKVEGSDAARGVQFTALTSSNEVFNVGFAGQVSPGTYQIMLPPGSYVLRGRVMTKDEVLNGSAKMTVTGRTNDPVILHLEPTTTVPVELAIDNASVGASSFAPPTSTSTGSTSSVMTQSTAPPDLNQFNLRLISLTEQYPNGQEEQIQLQQREDKTYAFHVAQGRYRLEAFGGGRWYAESASYGVDNLMSSDIVIASGGTSPPIRLVVNNAKGTAQATVTIPPNGDGVWVYLVPRTPSLTPINPMMVFDNGTGVGTAAMSVPAGSYVAIAVDHQLEEDLRNPEVVAKFSAQAKQVEVAASATATVALELAQEKETPP